VTLQIEHILDECDPVEMHKRLHSLPTNVTAAFVNVFERLSPSTRNFARRILGWIFHAKRILKMGELLEALAVQVEEVGVRSFDSRKMSSADLVVRACGGLIAYDRNSHLVTFSHETVRPFLDENELGNLPSHSDLCKVCMRSLEMVGPGWTDASIKELGRDLRESESGFSNYAARFWAAHAVFASETQRETELEAMIVCIFSNPHTRLFVETLGHSGDAGQPLLHFFIENKLNFLFGPPSPAGQLDRDT